MRKKVLMIAYTDYAWDARIKREAGTLAETSAYAVRLLCLKEGKERQSYVEDGVHVDELNIRKYSGGNPFKYCFSYLYFLIGCFFRCTRLLFQGELDLVHVHNMPNLLVFSALVPRIFGKKVILDMHDCMPEIFSEKFKRWSGLLFRVFCWEEAISCAFADRIICVNHVQKDVLLRRGVDPGKLFVSMNVPDHRMFRRMDPALRAGSVPDRFRMGYHGTIARRLGVDLAIRAVAELQERRPAIEFHFWGSGEYLQECQSLSRELQLNEKVCFNGVVKVVDLMKVLQGVDLGIVPNRRSTATEVMLPVKMLEYVTMGIPVLAPRLRAIQYYFTEEMVGYFEPDDLESLKSAILKVHGDESRGRGTAARAQQFLDQYGWDKQSADFIQFYHSI